MTCKICNSKNISVTYEGLIRDGALGCYTKVPVKMYKCEDCNVIWHDSVKNLEEYYESAEYRNELEGTTEEQDFYRLHDGESMQKFIITGTTVFRNKVVADIGCGCGAFLDFIKGVAKKIIAIEPSEVYRKIMDKKGFETFPYATSALKQYSEGVDVITSFDVIEHVESPEEFMKDAYCLLSTGGQAIIGTSTEAPVMRNLLGTIYEKKQLFSTQHPWVLSEKSLRIIAERAGFKNIKIKYFQRYAVGNLLGWIREKETRSEIKEDFLSEGFDSAWKAMCNEKGLSDYIVIYAEK